MKVTHKITELSHDNLVTLFADAQVGTGSNFTATYDHDEWDKIPTDKKEGDCWEDHLADMILNGKSITIIDVYADGEDNSCEGYGKINKSGDCEFEISLDNILYEASKEGAYRYAERVFGEDGDYDYWDAWNLIQYIIFGEVVYG